MSPSLVNFLNLANAGCWCVCFWWMHRISKRQNSVLEELAEQACRIEELSKKEHAILGQVHPNVEKIQHGVDQVAAKVERVEGRIANGEG
jgi:hypothetical protein